jgi:hypothetical protein
LCDGKIVSADRRAGKIKIYFQCIYMVDALSNAVGATCWNRLYGNPFWGMTHSNAHIRLWLLPTDWRRIGDKPIVVGAASE